MNTILAAVDFSKFSRPVIFDAVRFSQQFEAHLYILHVVTFPRDPLYGAAVSKSGGIGTAQETAVLKQIEQLVPPTSVQWRGVIRYGDPIEKIGEFCRDSEADLVMGFDLLAAVSAVNGCCWDRWWNTSPAACRVRFGSCGAPSLFDRKQTTGLPAFWSVVTSMPHRTRSSPRPFNWQPPLALNCIWHTQLKHR